MMSFSCSSRCSDSGGNLRYMKELFSKVRPTFCFGPTGGTSNKLASWASALPHCSENRTTTTQRTRRARHIMDDFVWFIAWPPIELSCWSCRRDEHPVAAPYYQPVSLV